MSTHSSGGESIDAKLAANSRSNSVFVSMCSGNGGEIGLFGI